MYQLANRGMGAVDPNNPNVPLNPCGTRWAWAIPTCWSIGNAIVYGDKYPAPPRPPVVGSTLPGGASIPAVPESGEAARATIDEIIGQQSEEWKAQNQQFFQDVNAVVNPGGIPWWVWLGGGLGIFAVVAMSGGSPRRYGR